MRVLAIGDVHTKMWVIDAVRKLVDDYDAIVLCGDYADDWNGSAVNTVKTWKELRSLSRTRPNVKLVTGNHDYLYTHDTLSWASGYSVVTQMLIDQPENKGLKEWVQNLPITVEIDGVTYSHAGLTKTYTEGDDLWADNSPIWARPYGGDRYRDIPQVFGHTPQSTCAELQRGIWCIDTFSTHSDGMPIGDGTVLEVVDGKVFNKRKLVNRNLPAYAEEMMKHPTIETDPGIIADFDTAIKDGEA